MCTFYKPFFLLNFVLSAFDISHVKLASCILQVHLLNFSVDAPLYERYSEELSKQTKIIQHYSSLQIFAF